MAIDWTKSLLRVCRQRNGTSHPSLPIITAAGTNKERAFDGLTPPVFVHQLRDIYNFSSSPASSATANTSLPCLENRSASEIHQPRPVEMPALQPILRKIAMGLLLWKMFPLRQVSILSRPFIAGPGFALPGDIFGRLCYFHRNQAYHPSCT